MMHDIDPENSKQQHASFRGYGSEHRRVHIYVAAVPSINPPFETFHLLEKYEERKVVKMAAVLEP